MSTLSGTIFSFEALLSEITGIEGKESIIAMIVWAEIVFFQTSDVGSTRVKSESRNYRRI
jgi:hypothetical protein